MDFFKQQNVGIQLGSQALHVIDELENELHSVGLQTEINGTSGPIVLSSAYNNDNYDPSVYLGAPGEYGSIYLVADGSNGYIELSANYPGTGAIYLNASGVGGSIELDATNTGGYIELLTTSGVHTNASTGYLYDDISMPSSGLSPITCHGKVGVVTFTPITINANNTVPLTITNSRSGSCGNVTMEILSGITDASGTNYSIPYINSISWNSGSIVIVVGNKGTQTISNASIKFTFMSFN